MKKAALLLLLLAPLALTAQRITPEEYIQTYKDIAMREMREHKIPASITLAQGILESGAGNSALAREAKNHFGIKCHKGWDGKTYHMDDDEKDECFRRYNSAEESFRDHSEFLCTRGRYSALFDLEITDYRGWAKGLKAAGYATNPKYAQLLIDRIELYDLTKYDQIALGLMTDDNQLPDIAPEDELLELAYSPTNRAAFELVDMTAEKRFIYENNGVRFVYAKEGETPEQLAKEILRLQFAETPRRDGLPQRRCGVSLQVAQQQLESQEIHRRRRRNPPRRGLALCREARKDPEKERNEERRPYQHGAGALAEVTFLTLF